MEKQNLSLWETQNEVLKWLLTDWIYTLKTAYFTILNYKYLDRQSEQYRKNRIVIKINGIAKFEINNITLIKNM